MTVIAIVDDDPELGSLIGDYLKTNGYESSLFISGEAFLDSDRAAIGLVVLDVGLPGMDGFSVCQKLREKSSVPIIMLTAASDDVDRILGLELGADDYMGKPFNPRELLARIKALLRRAEHNAQEARQLTIKQSDRRSFWQGQAIDLTGAEFDLLQLFYKRPGSVLSRDEISLALKGHGVSPFDRSIDTLVSRLRKKLKSASSSDLIRSVRGKGYVLSI
ncbi:response regulator transcription factor [Litorivicinus sp.]|jgi:DNA-binding response OmpR family regulator|nr:response regulator transcription factor [Litorivicinus sp.]MDG1156240.1 response regulator transcription factor [Litorivicinaceae bacterium]